MPEIFWSSVCIPAILASSGNNLWVNSLQCRSALPQAQRCLGWLFSGPSWFHHVSWTQLRLQPSWSWEQFGLGVVKYSQQAVPVLSAVSLQTGRFVEHHAEASWRLLRGPARDFQGFGRACVPSWFRIGMGISALWPPVFWADSLGIGPAQV